MDREQYIKMRKLNLITPIVLFGYYTEQVYPDNLVTTVLEFQQLFSVFLIRTKIDYQQCVTKATSYFDKKFKVCILRDEKGVILDIY